MNERVKNSAKTSRVKALIEREGLTNLSFAEKMDFEIDIVNKLSSGAAPLTLDRAMRISDTFNVSLDWLYERSDDTNDDAALILLYLDEFFNIRRRSQEKAEITTMSGFTEHREVEFVVNIDEDVKDFLLAIDNAKKAKEKSAIPDRALQIWIDEEKRIFNEKYKSSDKKRSVEYLLLWNKTEQKERENDG